LGRYSLLVHDELRAELLKLNTGDSEKLEVVQQLTQPGYEMVNAMKSPRFIKAHCPISLLPPNLLDVGCKVSLQNPLGTKLLTVITYVSHLYKKTYNG